MNAANMESLERTGSFVSCYSDERNPKVKESSSLMETLAAIGLPMTIYNMSISASMSGFLCGIDTGSINGASLLIRKEYHLNEHWVSNIVSATTGAAAISCIFAGIIADAYGRKPAIMMSAIVFTVGGVLNGVANGPYMILAGRITVGIGIGVVSTVVPVYISECSPPKVRGSLISLFQLFITIGIWLSAVGAVVFHTKEHGWRYMLGLSAIPGFLQYIFFVALPESPRYQVLNKNVEASQKVLRRIRNDVDVRSELDDIIDAHEDEPKARGLRVFNLLLTDPSLRYTLFVGCMVHLFQQFSGINIVLYYSSTILLSAGFDTSFAIGLSLIPLTINFLATFPGLWAVEAIGRKKTLGLSFLGNSLALIFLMLAFLPEHTHPHTTDAEYEKAYTSDTSGHCWKIHDCWACINDAHCGFCAAKTSPTVVVNGSCVHVDKEFLEFYARDGRCSKVPGQKQFKGGGNLLFSFGSCPLDYSFVAVIGLILFVMAFAPGAGPIPWTLNAELYPLWSRSAASSIATLTNWTCNFVVSKTFHMISDLLTMWGTFLFFSFVCTLGAAFTFLVVPETRDRTLEDIGRDPWTVPPPDITVPSTYTSRESTEVDSDSQTFSKQVIVEDYDAHQTVFKSTMQIAPSSQESDVTRTTGSATDGVMSGKSTRSFFTTINSVELKNENLGSN